MNKNLLEEVKEKYEAKDYTELSKIINVPYSTIIKWTKREINSTTKNYLNALLHIKEQERQIKLLNKKLEIIEDFKSLLSN